VLFIDECYSLGGDEAGHQDSFSQEAVRTILTEQENNRLNTVVILAGYPIPTGRFLRSDPGLQRRFPPENHITIKDYSAEQIAQITEERGARNNGVFFEPGLRERLVKHIDEQYRTRIPKENAGLAVNLLESAISEMQVRTYSYVGADEDTVLKTLTAQDFGMGLDPRVVLAQKRNAIEEKLSKLIGMQGLKKMLLNVKKEVEWVERGGMQAEICPRFQMQLVGNPGELVLVFEC
jgi:hypothetical protein